MIGDSVTPAPPPGRASAGGVASLFFAIALAPGYPAPPATAVQASKASSGISQVAADSCAAKVQRLEDYAAAAIPAGKVGQHTTRMTEDELNSYLEFELRPEYHASLKSLKVKLSESRLQGSASIDFDLVELKNNPLLTGLLRKMLAGVHSLTVLGNLISADGKAHFVLSEASFDGITLPNLLVAEIITAVCRKQNPPFDPMKPSVLPYHIQKVDLHAGYILVYQ
jgi:hypothetical protein